MSIPIRTVAVAGASGNLGPAVLNQLLAAEFTVTALTRADSRSTFPSAIKVVPVDYDSLDSLTAALEHEGVRSFCDSYQQLIACIETKLSQPELVT